MVFREVVLREVVVVEVVVVLGVVVVVVDLVVEVVVVVVVPLAAGRPLLGMWLLAWSCAGCDDGSQHTLNTTFIW